MNCNYLEYTYQQKIAMMRILLDIIKADGIDARETFFFNQLIKEFEMTEDDRDVVNEKNSLLALLQIREMNKVQKNYFAKLMTQMVIIDGDVNVNEVAIYDVVAEFCKLDESFNEQELPEGLTYS